MLLFGERVPIAWPEACMFMVACVAGAFAFWCLTRILYRMVD